jgi:cyclopropane fatty-acyl-phospholipid synthase-like methyltransferase
MMHEFGLKKDDSVLDLMCGYGRHSISLARKGLNVTSIDNLTEYVSEIKNAVQKESLPIKCIEENILDYQPTGFFNLAICMGNSLNFFNQGDAISIIGKVSNCLKPGSKFLIHTWSLTEIVAKNFREKSWSYISSTKFLSDSKFLLHPSRIETENIFIDEHGNTERKTGIDYLFSLNEMEQMFNNSGFQVIAVYSIPGKKKFSLGDQRAYIVAEKI